MENKICYGYLLYRNPLKQFSTCRGFHSISEVMKSQGICKSAKQSQGNMIFFWGGSQGRKLM